MAGPTLVTGGALLQWDRVQHLPTEQRQNLTTLLSTYRRQQQLSRRLVDATSSESSAAYEERIAAASKLKANMHVKEPLSAVVSYNVEGHSADVTNDRASRPIESCQKCTSKHFRYFSLLQVVCCSGGRPLCVYEKFKFPKEKQNTKPFV